MISGIWERALPSNFVVSLRNKHFFCVCFHFDMEIRVLIYH